MSSREHPLSIAELLRRAGAALAEAVGQVWVEGELTQLSRPGSGHLYFSLRDGSAVVGAVMWKSDAARVRFSLEAGQRLRVRGKLGIYDRDGRMQLYVDFVEPAGLGAAALALEQLKQRLAAEGLFAEGRKRPLPLVPRRIGVVTSRTGAALQDILRTVERRFPVPIAVADCMVQGAAAPRQIVLALQLAAAAGVDVIIVGRGGGSVNDLSAFNDEAVVRAVATCPVPVVSAVGHEVDLSLCDLAADRRASTPTAAAELVVPVRVELQAQLAKDERRLRREIDVRIANAREDLDRTAGRGQRLVERRVSGLRDELRRLEARRDRLHPRSTLLGKRLALAGLLQRLEARAARRVFFDARHTLADLGRRLQRQELEIRVGESRAELHRLTHRAEAALARRTSRARGDFHHVVGQLHALSPLAVLERGYSVLSAGSGVVRDVRSLEVGDRVVARLHRGVVELRVEGIREELP